ncbi:MAG TPA: carboxypeptidase M32 [Pirellulales bacterium]|jgi:carboxypeptidase Taq|nr:carboxypeptidase M32 [Pirellulales bacterium]
MTNTVHDTYARLRDHVRTTGTLTSIDALLGWDERCLLPSHGGEHRAEQMTVLAGMIHARQTDPQLGEWLAELADSPLAADPASDTAANIRQLRKQYDKKTRLPRALVEALARAAVRGQQAWEEARKTDNFAHFQPHLEQMISLKRQQADCIGFRETRYDALLDDFEQDALTSDVARVLEALREQLVPLVAAIAGSSRRPDVTILERSYPIEAQQMFGRQAAERIGFDFKSGRLDVTAHPFCSTMGPHDVRLTTRYDEHYFNGGFFGILHEAGHGLYEQGLRAEEFGLPTGEAISLGIHESQSRMWENLVGRSEAFWRHHYPLACAAYPDALADVPLEKFYFAINDVRPSPIRVEADEATYNLHILVRFELEQALIDDQLKVADLPGVWNEKYHAALGIKPPSDADGVLQDIHWSAGLIGYFATYSLGNLYASQFFEQATADLGNLDDAFEHGDYAPLLDWLRKNIHSQGQRYSATELVRRVTGSALDHEPLMRHLWDKFGPLYGL